MSPLKHEEFVSLIPPRDLKKRGFQQRLLDKLNNGIALTLEEIVPIARESNITETKRIPYEKAVEREVMRVPGVTKRVKVGPYGQNSDDSPTYYCLRRFLGPKGEPVRNVLYKPLEHAIRTRQPDFDDKVVHQIVSAITETVKRNGILTRGDVEEVATNQYWDRTGLIGVNKRRTARIDYFKEACQALGLYSPN